MKKEIDVKEKILDESIKLFLSKGFYGSTTNELIRLAGISKGALYWHFKNKSDILSSILNKYRYEFVDVSKEILDNPEKTFSKRFNAFYKFTSEFARDNRELLLVFTSLLVEFAGTGSEIEKEMKETYQQYVLMIQKSIENGIQEGAVKKEINAIIYSRIIAATLMGSHILWHLYFTSYEDNPDFNRQHAIIQRNELLKMLLA
jgi:AcrR family transcriptional regulator